MVVQAFRDYRTPEEFERAFGGKGAFPHYTTLIGEVRKCRQHRDSDVIGHLCATHGPNLASALKYRKGSRIVTMKRPGSMVKRASELLALDSFAGHLQADQENVPPAAPQ